MESFFNITKPDIEAIEQSDRISDFNMVNGDPMKFMIKPQRINILLPKLSDSGKPSCIETPDDTYCESVDNYPK